MPEVIAMQALSCARAGQAPAPLIGAIGGNVLGARLADAHGDAEAQHDQRADDDPLRRDTKQERAVDEAGKKNKKADRINDECGHERSRGTEDVPAYQRRTPHLVPSRREQ